MDIQMPGLNGYETTKDIRKEAKKNSYIPIIAITAYAMKEDKEKSMQSGMDNYITKPFEMEKLHQLLEYYLGAEKEREKDQKKKQDKEQEKEHEK